MTAGLQEPKFALGQRVFYATHHTTQGRHDLMSTTYVPHVRTLTVGKIGIVYRYMCNETGIGSGNVYDENLLFASEERAMLHARFLAHQAQIDHDQRVQAQRDEQKKRAKRRARKVGA